MANETGIKRDEPWHFDIFSEDTGGYAGVALRYIELENSESNGEMILCVPNEGAIPELRYNDVVEITCDVDKNGCVTHKMQNLPEENVELIRRVKSYERYAARAIVKKDKKLALYALMLHPLVNSYSIAKSLLDEYLELNKDYIGGFN